jgi:hypothetical protein
MANFRLWGKVEHVAPNQFVVLVTAMPVDGGTPRVKTVLAQSREAGRVERDKLMKMAEADLIAQGSAVIERERDG